MGQCLTLGRPTDDLLECPFCGGKAEFRDGSSRSEAKLVAAWNRRAR